MKSSRRAFLGATAALPVAAAAAALPNEGVILPAEPAPPVLTPYREYPWQWSVSRDGNVYHEFFDTMAEAVEYAKGSEYNIVAEVLQTDLDLSVEGYDIIERINDQNSELIGDGEGLDPTSEQEDDLGKMVTATVEAWAVKHNISLTAWGFASVRNKIEIPLPPLRDQSMKVTA